MFFEICMKRLVVLQPHKLHNSQLYLKAAILTQLLEDMKALKCSEDHGYYVTATTLENIGEGKVRCHTGAVVFPLEFKCIVFKPYQGEILHGEVKQVVRRGCFLSCGPLVDIFLHVEMMEGFEYQTSESVEFSMFRHGNGSEIKVGTTLRFKILGLKWIEELRIFRALGTINGNFLGCIEGQTDEI